jgi:Lipid A 3-O-deacylase (PagL)
MAGALFLCFGYCLKAQEAERFSFDSVGARFGFAATHSVRGFRAGEAFLDCNLPVAWQLGELFSLKTRMDFTAGWLGREGLNAVTSSAGPAFVLKYKDVPLALEAGSSSGLISRHEFGSVDLGGPFQFTTHIGLSWDITKHFRAGYRYQHTSNGGIDRSNPGLNLHAFACSYVF